MQLRKPRFDSSAHGKIQQVLLTLPSWVLRYAHQLEIRDTAAVYKNVLQAFDSSVQFLLITHEEAESHLFDWLENLSVTNHTTTILVPNESKLDIWAQDAFVTCSDECGDRWLIQPKHPQHTSVELVGRLVAEQLGLHRCTVSSRFQSGNVLVGDRFWLLGADSDPNSSQPTEDPVEAKESFDSSNTDVRDWLSGLDRDLYLIQSRIPVPGFTENAHVQETQVDDSKWHEVVYRGNRANTRQPIFHIDSFITLAGRNQDGQYNILVGDPRYAVNELSMQLPKHAMAEIFDDIADQLSLLGFSVIRNPLPLVFYDNYLTKTRYWYFATSNNALVEITESERTVWLPNYGHGRWESLSKTDAINEEIWQSLGYKTNLLGNHHQFAMNLGATHCIAKCLRS